MTFTERAAREMRQRIEDLIDAPAPWVGTFHSIALGWLREDGRAIGVLPGFRILAGAERWIWRQERCDFPKLLAECVVLTAAPVRREALDAVGGYDGERFAEGDEDWDFWISLVERGFRGTIVPEVLFDYRQREDSMRRVAMQSEVRQRVWRNLLDKHRANLALARYKLMEVEKSLL